MKVVLALLLCCVSVGGAADYVGNLAEYITAYLENQGVVLEMGDYVTIGTVSCNMPVVYENGSIYQDCQGGAICEICRHRVGEYVTRENKTYCFEDWKRMKA